MLTAEPAAEAAARPLPQPLLPDDIPEAPLRSGLGTFASLRYPNFRLLWAGTCFMSAGQWIQQVTLGWLVYDMTSSPALLGILGAVRTLPFLLVSPTAGVVADRVDRRMLIVGVEAYLMITVLIMGTVVASGRTEVWHLFLFTIATGVAWCFNQPARIALVPNVVPSHDLMNAMALNSLGFNMTKIIGPTMGGVLIAFFGAGGNFFVQAATYGAVVMLVYSMQLPPTPRIASSASALANLKEGVEYVRSTPPVLALLVLSIVPSMLVLPYLALMPVFARDVLGVGPDGLGVLLAAPGVGAVVAALVLATIASRITQRGPVLVGCLVCLGISLILFSQTTSLPLALAALVAVGGTHIFFASFNNTLLQQIIPDELRGRVTSLHMLEVGLAPAGTLVAGLTTQAFGSPITIAVMGAAVLVLGLLVGWRFPIVPAKAS